MGKRGDVALVSCKERRRRILPADAISKQNTETGGDGYPLPQYGVCYTLDDVGEACGLAKETVRDGFSGEVDCLRDVSLYVAGKIFEREADGAHKRKVRGRRKVII